MRRTQAIDEASFGLDHPNVARDLNNLAGLFGKTNRLVEAVPLMRRAVVAHLSFQHSNGQAHTDRDLMIDNYRGLLTALGHDDAEIDATIEEAYREAGLTYEKLDLPMIRTPSFSQTRSDLLFERHAPVRTGPKPRATFLTKLRKILSWSTREPEPQRSRPDTIDHA